MKKILKNNIKLLIGLIIGSILTGSIVYGSTSGYLYDSDEVNYNNQTSGLTATDVQSALDELNNSCSRISSLYSVSVSVNNGSITGDTTKYVSNGGILKFTVTPASYYNSSTPTISCTNSQTATWASNTLTTGALTNNSVCTVSFVANIYSINLNNQGADSGNTGTSTIYEKYNTGYYLNSTATTQMTTSSNGITVPVKTGYTFGGYYTATDGGGTQYIDANGKLTSSANNKNFTASGTLYAKWTIKTYSVSVNVTNGTVTGETTKSVNHGSTTTFTITRNSGYNCDKSITPSAGTYSGTTFTTGAITGNTSYDIVFGKSSTNKRFITRNDGNSWWTVTSSTNKCCVYYAEDCSSSTCSPTTESYSSFSSKINSSQNTIAFPISGLDCVPSTYGYSLNCSSVPLTNLGVPGGFAYYSSYKYYGSHGSTVLSLSTTTSCD